MLILCAVQSDYDPFQHHDLVVTMIYGKIKCEKWGAK